MPSSYDGEINEAGLVAFEEKFFKGDLSPSLKSEEPSDEDTAQPVKVLKGKSFSKLVLENGELIGAPLFSADVRCVAAILTVYTCHYVYRVIEVSQRSS